MGEQLKRNWFKIIIVIILSIATIVFYQSQQAQIQIQRNKQANEYETEQTKLLLEEKRQKVVEEKELKKKIDLGFCLENADIAYWNYIEINGIFNEEDETYWATDNHWDLAEKRRELKEDKCFRLYK